MSARYHRGDLSGTTWTWRNLTNKGATGDSIHPDQHAIAFEPGLPDTYKVLAYVYRSLRRPQEAIDNFNRYLQLQPNASDASRVRQDLQQLQAQLQGAAPEG